MGNLCGLVERASLTIRRVPKMLTSEARKHKCARAKWEMLPLCDSYGARTLHDNFSAIETVGGALVECRTEACVS